MGRQRERGKGSSEEQRAERRAAERRLMADAVEQLQSSEGWQRWLRVRRHFHDYSLHNQLLIAFQHPGATRVAGFRRWLALGYAVRKGERAIRIWAPCPPSRKAIERWRREGADPQERPRTWFRMAAVFDTLSRARARRPRSLEAWSGGWRRWRPTGAEREDGGRREEPGGR
jgi:N-terminal domain of anti-restriction factor ArdC